MRLRGLRLRGAVVAKAVSRDGKAFCCDECADGHPHQNGCDHAGCTCHG